MNRGFPMIRYARSLLAFAILLILGGGALAQGKVRTESIRPPASAADAKDNARKDSTQDVPEIITDLSQLPAPVARMRERILAAARSGDLKKVVSVMQTNGTMPIFSLGEERDPEAFWKGSYPDSDGIEALSILISILETPFVHVEKGTPQEIYLWPYFARMPLKALTPEQRVELFRIVTGADYKEMLEFGAYSFYRLGISPDGTWHFFVAGD